MKITLKNATPHSLVFNDLFKNELCILTCNGSFEVYKIKGDQGIHKR